MEKKISQITLVNAKNTKYQCSGCDHLCAILTGADAPPFKVIYDNICLIAGIEGAAVWREV